MPLTLEQYASWLDTRDLPWPAPPDVQKPKAKPHLKKLSDIRAVLWDVYGTLLTISGGELYFVHPQDLFMGIALDKTVQEFNMWGSMSRKPGQPGEYLKQLYTQELDRQVGVTTGGEKHPEVCTDKIWEAIFKKLFQKDYTFDAGFYGSLNELSQKVAYFFHASMQGTGLQNGCEETLSRLKDQGITQGLLGDGQHFTGLQLQRALQATGSEARLNSFIPDDLRILSYKVRARKPSETLFDHALSVLGERGISSQQILHVGSQIERDIAPARRLGMRTALYAGDKASLKADPEQLKDPKKRPDVLVTDLSQIADIIA